MKKPWFIRLFGWLFWCGGAWIALLWTSVGAVGNDPHASQDAKAGLGLVLLGMPIYFVLTGFCLVVWLVGSLVAWYAQQKNRPPGYYYPVPSVTVQPTGGPLDRHPHSPSPPARPRTMTSPLGLSSPAENDQN